MSRLPIPYRFRDGEGGPPLQGLKKEIPTIKLKNAKKVKKNNFLVDMMKIIIYDTNVV